MTLNACQDTMLYSEVKALIEIPQLLALTWLRCGVVLGMNVHIHYSICQVATRLLYIMHITSDVIPTFPGFFLNCEKEKSFIDTQHRRAWLCETSAKIAQHTH